MRLRSTLWTAEVNKVHRAERPRTRAGKRLRADVDVNDDGGRLARGLPVALCHRERDHLVRAGDDVDLLRPVDEVVCERLEQGGMIRAEVDEGDGDAAEPGVSSD